LIGIVTIYFGVEPLAERGRINMWIQQPHVSCGHLMGSSKSERIMSWKGIEIFCLSRRWTLSFSWRSYQTNLTF